MNVFKKIKRFASKPPFLFLGLALFTSASFAAPQPKVTGAENLTPGYVSLLLDYSHVQQQMRAAITQGQQQQWRNWMDTGLKKNETLYWWLLADWLATTGKNEEAYKALVQALVFMKVEMSTCGGGSSQGTEFIEGMLKRYGYIVTAKHQQTTIKSAVLEAVTRTENQLNRGQILSGMSCHALEVARAQKGRSQTIRLTPPSTEQRAFQRKLEQQRNALRGIKEDMAYGKMWDSSDTKVLWNLQEIK